MNYSTECINIVLTRNKEHVDKDVSYSLLEITDFFAEMEGFMIATLDKVIKKHSLD